MKIDTFKRVMGRRPRRVRPFSLLPERNSTPLPAASLPHYWYPGRDGVEFAPDDFRHQLHAIHESLECVRPPAAAPLPHKWAIWMRKPSVTYWLCPGWSLLFIWPPDPYTPIPLDNRVFANLYRISRRKFGNAVKYFDHCVSEMQREKAARQKDFDSESRDRRRDMLRSHRISNIGRGNKFALHHDGTLLPSRGQLNWLKDTRKQRLPKEIIDDLIRQRDERGY